MTFSEKNFDNENKATKSSLFKTKKTFSCSDLLNEELEYKKDNVLGKNNLAKLKKEKKFKFSDNRFEKCLNSFDQNLDKLSNPLDCLINNIRMKLKKNPLKI